MIPSFSKILVNFSGSTFTKGGGAGGVDAPQPMAVETTLNTREKKKEPRALSLKGFDHQKKNESSAFRKSGVELSFLVIVSIKQVSTYWEADPD